MTRFVTSALAGAVCLSLAAWPAHATGFVEPLMEPEVIADDAIAAAGTGGGWVVPLILLALIAAAASASGGSSSPVPPMPATN